MTISLRHEIETEARAELAERERIYNEDREERTMTCAQVNAWARRMEAENAAYQAAELAAPIADAVNGWLRAIAPRRAA